MAAIGMMIGGAIVNALAFTGGSYLFSLLGRSDEAEKERKRHDLAIEALQRAESEYYFDVSPPIAIDLSCHAWACWRLRV